MDCSHQDPSVHARQECWCCHATLLRRSLPAQGLNPRLLHLLRCERVPLPLAPPRKALPFAYNSLMSGTRTGPCFGSRAQSGEEVHRATNDAGGYGGRGTYCTPFHLFYTLQQSNQQATTVPRTDTMRVHCGTKEDASGAGWAHTAPRKGGGRGGVG